MGWKKVEEPEGRWAKAKQRFTENVEAVKTGLTKETGDFLQSQGYHPDVEYFTDVPHPGLRMDLSAADTDPERERVLNRYLGANGWTQDPGGRYVATPLGLSRIGQEGNAPVAIDALRPTVSDLYDWHGDVGALGGSMLGAGAAIGAGFPVLGVMGMAGLAAMGGMGYQEAIEEAQGKNLETSPEIGMRMGQEGLLATVGEGFQGTLVSPFHRKVAAPYLKQIDEGTLDALADARKMGVYPSFNQVKPHPLIGRAARIGERLFGEHRTAENALAMSKELSRMLDDMSIRAQNESVTGQAVKSHLRAAKQAWAKEMEKRYKGADLLIGDSVGVSTARLKEVASDIMDDLPKVDGKPVWTDPSTQKWVAETLALPDEIPIREMRALRTTVRESFDSEKLLAGVSEGRKRRIHGAATRAIEDVRVNPNTPAKIKLGIKNLQIANRKYREGIETFDDDLIARMVKKGGRKGGVDPELIVESMFKPRRESQIRRVMQHLPEDLQGDVQRSAFERMISDNIVITDDPMTDLLDGKKFYKALQKYGKPTLKAMFGETATDNMFRFARVAKVAGRKQRDQGGLVAAAIATRPFQNLGRLAQLRIVHGIFQTKWATNWLTTGIESQSPKEVADALSRLTIYVNSLVDEETAKAQSREQPAETTQ